MFCFLPAEREELPGRILNEVTVPHVKLTRSCQLAIPGQTRQAVAEGHPVLHPGDHDPAAVRSDHRLRSVEIKTKVDRATACLIKCKGGNLLSALTDKVHGLAFFGKHASLPVFVQLACQEETDAVQIKDVRTFPHCLFRVMGEDVFKLPCQSVFT